jgi:hypothetical protein
MKRSRIEKCKERAIIRMVPSVGSGTCGSCGKTAPLVRHHWRVNNSLYVEFVCRSCNGLLGDNPCGEPDWIIKDIYAPDKCECGRKSKIHNVPVCQENVIQIHKACCNCVHKDYTSNLNK